MAADILHDAEILVSIPNRDFSEFKPARIVAPMSRPKTLFQSLIGILASLNQHKGQVRSWQKLGFNP